MTLADLRAAAIDRALVGDDPQAALALAGAADIADATRLATGPVAAAMLAVAVTAADTDPPLDERAWRPGSDADSLALVGAAAAVRTRDVSLDRAAALADCTPAAIEKAARKRH